MRERLSSPESIVIACQWLSKGKSLKEEYFKREKTLKTALELCGESAEIQDIDKRSQPLLKAINVHIAKVIFGLRHTVTTVENNMGKLHNVLFGQGVMVLLSKGMLDRFQQPKLLLKFPKKVPYEGRTMSSRLKITLCNLPITSELSLIHCWDKRAAKVEL